MQQARHNNQYDNWLYTTSWQKMQQARHMQNQYEIPNIVRIYTTCTFQLKLIIKMNNWLIYKEIKYLTEVFPSFPFG